MIYDLQARYTLTVDILLPLTFVLVTICKYYTHIFNSMLYEWLHTLRGAHVYRIICIHNCSYILVLMVVCTKPLCQHGSVRRYSNGPR